MKTVASELLMIAKSLVATRPIPVDKNEVKRFIDDVLLPSIFWWAEKRDPNAPLGLQIICNKVFTFKNVRKETINLDVTVLTRRSSSSDVYVGGSYIRRKDAGDNQIVLILNEGIYPSAILEVPNRLGSRLYSAMIHELTHALDTYPSGDFDMDYKKGKPAPGNSYDSKTIDYVKYVNNPYEVRAHMQQIVDEIMFKVSLPSYLGYLRRMYPNEIKNKMFGKEAMYMLSKTWASMVDTGMTKENQKKILKAVYRTLEDNGLFERIKEVNDGAVLE